MRPMTAGTTHALNLFDLRPKRNAEWETGANGNVVVLVPKFRNPFMTRWLVPLLRNPFVRVKLDQFGSFVWSRCDGNTPVGEIADVMSTAFGEPVETIAGRLQRFINQLERGALVVLSESEGASVPE